MYMRRAVCILMLLLAWGAMLSPASAQDENGWCLHKQMYAVPAPAKVVIDGKLDDWDLSGAIDVYVMPETREMQNAKFAVMYDNQALYLGAIVRDPTPMQNSINPETDGDSGWDGDALQFRMCVDPDHKYPLSDFSYLTAGEHDLTLANLTMWYYTDRQQPNLAILRGMVFQSPPGSKHFGVIPNANYHAKYLMAADKKGYSVEYRIPWSVIGAKRPFKGGDISGSAMQVMWGKAGNEHVSINGVTYDLQTTGGFAYQNSAIWGKVIYAKTGHLPKELVNVGLPPEKPLPLAFSYDLPESSQVTLQLFNDKNQVVRVLAGEAARNAGKNIERWDGLDTNGNPLRAGRYTWKGLYHQPITTQPVLSVANSGNPPWRTDANNGGWGGDEGNPCGSCAVGNDVVLCWACAEAGWGIIRVNTEGQKQWGILRFAIHMASDGERIYVSNDSDEDVLNPYKLTESTGVEVLAKKDFSPLLFGNGAKVLQAPPGGGGTDNFISGLACAGGRVYVSYRKRNLIGSYDAQSGELKDTFTVPAPAAMAAANDGSLVVLSEKKLVVLKNGTVTPLTAEHLDEPKGVAVDAAGLIYVANQGTLQNVSVFSADGRYLRSIGKAGGRPRMGNYDPTGMLNPYSVTIDAKGQLWVTEYSDSPKRVSVWNTGDGHLAKEFFGDAMYSSFSWMDPEHPDEVYCDGALWNVDLQNKTWSMKSTLWRSSDPNSPGQFAFYTTAGLRLFTAKNGRQYAWGIDDRYNTVLWMREGNVLKPLLAFIWTKGYPVVEKIYPTDGNGATYAWVDANGDGIIQAEEILPQELGKSWFRGFTFVDRDLNLWHPSGTVYRPLRILPDGRPEYDFSKPETVPMREIASVDDAGNIYTLSANGGKPENVGYGKWSLDGRLQWGLLGAIDWPNALSLPAQKPGKLWGPTLLIGSAGEFTGFTTYFGVVHLYTSDGLFVSRIFRDGRVITSVGPDVIACENNNGCLVKPKGMERFFFVGGDQDGRVTEILGLDTIKRLPGGEYVVSEDESKKAAAALADYQAKITQAQALTIAHGKAALDTVQPVSKTLDASRKFEAKAAYDDKNLYVKYTVTSPIRLVNECPDPSLLFHGGNCLDIQLAAKPQADPKRKTPVPGDLRILVSRHPSTGSGQGKTIAVIYRPKVKDFKGTPIVFRTGNTESFDSITTSDRITLDYQEDNNLNSFTAVVTIPLEVMGWTPKAGTKVKMDLGYIYGNEGGTKALARSYWKNNGFYANVLNDVPIESRIEPAEWGEAQLE